MVAATLLLAGFFAQANLKTPMQVFPAEGTVMYALPREVTLEWSPVERAESYYLEVDFMNACARDRWCSETGPNRTQVYRDLQVTKFTVESHGDFPARWRAWATAGFLESEKSPWRTFYLRSEGLPTPPAAPVPVSPEESATVHDSSRQIALA